MRNHITNLVHMPCVFSLVLPKPVLLLGIGSSNSSPPWPTGAVPSMGTLLKLRPVSTSLSCKVRSDFDRLLRVPSLADDLRCDFSIWRASFWLRFSIARISSRAAFSSLACSFSKNLRRASWINSGRSCLSTSLRLRMRKPLSKEVRIADVGDIGSMGDATSGESARSLERLECDVASANRDKDGTLVWMRRGCDSRMGLLGPANDGVGFERFELLRKVCRSCSSSSVSAGLFEWECSLSRSEV